MSTGLRGKIAKPTVIASEPKASEAISKKRLLRRFAPRNDTFSALSLFLIFFLCSQPAPASPNNESPIDLNIITIPKEFGKIKEVYQSPYSGRDDHRIILHIQDLHANYEAQKRLADILEYLVKSYAIDIVLIEGRATDEDFSYIREWAAASERKEKADELLKEGVISGEDYVSIATDIPLKFQGIEDKGLYEKNVEHYLKIGAFRKETLKIIGQFKTITDSLKKPIYTRRLSDFDRYKENYNSEKIELIEYLEYFNAIASKEKLDLKNFRNYSALLKTARAEKEINFNSANRERDNLIMELNKFLPKEAFNELIRKSLGFKQEKISAGEFHAYLASLAKEYNINMKKYPNLARYAEYIKDYEGLNHEGLFREVEEIEEILSQALCKNEEQKTLFKISKDILVLDALFKLKLMPEEFDYYKANRQDFNPEGWLDFLKSRSERFRLKTQVPETVSAINENLAFLEGFYETSFERDRAFIKNSFEKMAKEKEETAILIAGGFHTKNLTRLFAADNISYLVITPNVTKKADDLLYDRSLKESYRTRNWVNP